MTNLLRLQMKANAKIDAEIVRLLDEEGEFSVDKLVLEITRCTPCTAASVEKRVNLFVKVNSNKVKRYNDTVSKRW